MDSMSCNTYGLYYLEDLQTHQVWPVISFSLFSSSWILQMIINTTCLMFYNNLVCETKASNTPCSRKGSVSATIKTQPLQGHGTIRS